MRPVNVALTWVGARSVHCRRLGGCGPPSWAMIGLLHGEAEAGLFLWVSVTLGRLPRKSRSRMNEETAETTRKLNQRRAPARAEFGRFRFSGYKAGTLSSAEEALKIFGLRKCVVRTEDVVWLVEGLPGRSAAPDTVPGMA